MKNKIMKTFLIRVIEENLYHEIKRRAETESVSINKFILSILRIETGFSAKVGKRKKFIDHEELAGRWDEEEYRSINREIGRQRKVDKELWD